MFGCREHTVTESLSCLALILSVIRGVRESRSRKKEKRKREMILGAHLTALWSVYSEMGLSREWRGADKY